MSTRPAIGDRLRQARVAAGMSQTEVVDSLAEHGVSLTKAGLSKYERGGSVPKPRTLRTLAQVLGVDTAFFLEERAVSIEWLAFRKGFPARQETAGSESRPLLLCKWPHCIRYGARWNRTANLGAL